MLEELAKNFWILLTLIIPGMFTYGAWRLILLMEPGSQMLETAFSQIDNSNLVTTCVIVAIAIIQQAIAILIEALLTLLAKKMFRKWPNFHALFCERFSLSAAGRLNKNALRIIGNFFLSTNTCVGIGLLIMYFYFFESLSYSHWILICLFSVLIVTLIAAGYRLINAKWVIKECKKKMECSETDQTR